MLTRVKHQTVRPSPSLQPIAGTEDRSKQSQTHVNLI